MDSITRFVVILCLVIFALVCLRLSLKCYAEMISQGYSQTAPEDRPRLVALMIIAAVIAAVIHGYLLD
jgi:predicted secreted protein